MPKSKEVQQIEDGKLTSNSVAFTVANKPKKKEEVFRKLYTANLDNEVVVFATNLKDFVAALQLLEPSGRVGNYAYYKREFMKTSVIPLIIDDTKVYCLQEVYNGD